MGAKQHGVVRHAAAGGGQRLRRWSDAALEAWIGLALPPASRVVADREWSPDAPDAYCGRCGMSVGPGEATPGGCGSCRDGSGIGDAVVRLGPYADDLRTWILRIKFHRWFEMAGHLGRRLGDRVAAAGVVDPRRAIIVPVPMPWTRRIYRGIDHARAIGEGVGRALGCPVVPLLARSGGPPQVSLPASERRRRGGRDLRLRRFRGRVDLAGIEVILVDDVLTTGGTLRAAVRRVRGRMPERVSVAVLAVTADTARRPRRRLERGWDSSGGGSEAVRGGFV